MPVTSLAFIPRTSNSLLALYCIYADPSPLDAIYGIGPLLTNRVGMLSVLKSGTQDGNSASLVSDGASFKDRT